MNESVKNKITVSTRDAVLVGMFAAVMAVCAWITVPAAVPFTMQIFGVYAALLLLGGRRGNFAIIIYILLGIVGIPVFQGFTGGVGVIAGPTGGYILGFFIIGIVYWLATALFPHNKIAEMSAMITGLLLCYLFGTLWFALISSGDTSLSGVLMMCVVPFILPDIIKIALAVALRKALGRRNIENMINK